MVPRICDVRLFRVGDGSYADTPQLTMCVGVIQSWCSRRGAVAVKSADATLLPPLVTAGVH